jgi:hypothetical protein
MLGVALTILWGTNEPGGLGPVQGLLENLGVRKRTRANE